MWKFLERKNHTLIGIINFAKLAHCWLCTNLGFTYTIRTAHVEMRKCQIWIIELSWKPSLCRPNMCSTAPILILSVHSVNIFLRVYSEYVFEHTLCLVGKCHSNNNKILNSKEAAWEYKRIWTIDIQRLKMSPISIYSSIYLKAEKIEHSRSMSVYTDIQCRTLPGLVSCSLEPHNQGGSSKGV